MPSPARAPERRPAIFASLVQLCVSGLRFGGAYPRVACFSQRLSGDVLPAPGPAQLYESFRARPLIFSALQAQLFLRALRVPPSCAAMCAHCCAFLSAPSPGLRLWPAARPNCAQLCRSLLLPAVVGARLLSL